MAPQGTAGGGIIIGGTRLVSEGGSFSDITIPYLLDIWVFPGLFAGC